jgi:hypothetical protein
MRIESRSRHWGIVRLCLGFLQVFGASLAAVLLLLIGMTDLTLIVVALTCLCTTVSVLLFGARRDRSS